MKYVPEMGSVPLVAEWLAFRAFEFYMLDNFVETNKYYLGNSDGLNNLDDEDKKELKKVVVKNSPIAKNSIIINGERLYYFESQEGIDALKELFEDK